VRVALALSAILLLPSVACAQAGWYLLPSITVSNEFDDNVFGTSSGRESDFIIRGAPELRGGYRSEPLAILASFGIDAEHFFDHPELSGVANRLRSTLDVRYVPERPTTLAFAGTFLRTETPGDLQPQLGLEQGRQTTTGYTLAPSVSHRFGRSYTLDALYTYGTVTSGDFESTSHLGSLTLSSQVTRVDTGTARYSINFLESGAAEPTTSHTLALGWTRRFSALTSASITAGPRYVEGGLEPDVNVSLSHRFKLTTLTVSYIRTESAVIGQDGRVETNTGTASLAFAPGFVPLRSLGATAGVAFTKTSAVIGEDTDVYRATAGLTYRFNRWITASLAYQFSIQKTDTQILHNIVSFGLTATYPLRVD
jgi:hypothetical protein